MFLSAPPSETEATTAYAHWGERLGAWVLDLVAVTVLTSAALPAILQALGVGAIETVFGTAVLLTMAMPPVLVVYTGMTQGAQRGQTLGKWAVGIAVRRSRGHQRLGYARSFFQSLVTLAALGRETAGIARQDREDSRRARPPLKPVR